MPVVPCRHCGHEQSVRSELLNLLVTCSSCGKEFRVKEPDSPDVARRPGRAAAIAEEPLTSRAVLKGVALTAGLALAGVLVVGLAVLVLRTPEPPKTALTGQYGKWKEGASERGKKSEDDAAKHEDSEKAVKTALSVAAVLVIVLVFAYLLAVMLAGGWVARDAYARNLNGLGWAAFYYASQVFFRVMAVVFLVLPLAVFLGDHRYWAVLVVEPASWIGFGIYLFARPWGKRKPCQNCRQGCLHYLVTCPRCGATNADG